MNCRLNWLVAVVLALASTTASADSKIQQSRALQQQALAAYKAGNFADAAKTFGAALALRPHHPALLYNFAASSAKAGDTDHVVQALGEYAAMGLYADVEHDADFEALKDMPAFKVVLAKLKANLAPIGTSTVAATVLGAPFLAEGLAFDAGADRFFMSSVDQRKIIEITTQGQGDFVPAGSSGMMGAFGLALDAAAGRLWVATSGVAHTAGLASGEMGSGGVFSFAQSDGHLLSKAALPKGAKDLVIGDVAVAADGSVFATDSLSPTIYSVAQNGNAFTPWLTSADFGSLQGLTTTPDGTKLIVADYATGLNFIDRKTKQIEAIEFAGGTTLVGIDGLYRSGNVLLAVQNGVQPNRLLGISLAGDAKLRPRVISANDPNIPEPSLGTIRGNEFCVVANAQWSKFKDDGTRTAALDPPRIACVAIRK